MSYINEIFARLDTQHFREFLLHGVECVKTSSKTYKQRLDEALIPAMNTIENKVSAKDECEEITPDAGPRKG